MEDVNENDFIIPTDFKFQFKYNQNDKNLSENPAIKSFEYFCFVEKVISNTMIVTKNECKELYMHKGDYIIQKKLNKFSEDNFIFKDSSIFDGNIKIKNLNNIDNKNTENLNENNNTNINSNINKIDNKIDNILNDYDKFKDYDNNIINKENYFAPLDLDILTNISFPNNEESNYAYENSNYYNKENENDNNNYFFHYGYLVKNLENTVFSFDLRRMYVLIYL